jgi:hypothetical protein
MLYPSLTKTKLEGNGATSRGLDFFAHSSISGFIDAAVCHQDLIRPTSRSSPSAQGRAGEVPEVIFNGTKWMLPRLLARTRKYCLGLPKVQNFRFRTMSQ